MGYRCAPRNRGGADALTAGPTHVLPGAPRRNNQPADPFGRAPRGRDRQAQTVRAADHDRPTDRRHQPPEQYTCRIDQHAAHCEYGPNHSARDQHDTRRHKPDYDDSHHPLPQWLGHHNHVAKRNDDWNCCCQHPEPVHAACAMLETSSAKRGPRNGNNDSFKYRETGRPIGFGTITHGITPDSADERRPRLWARKWSQPRLYRCYQLETATGRRRGGNEAVRVILTETLRWATGFSLSPRHPWPGSRPGRDRTKRMD